MEIPQRLKPHPEKMFKHSAEAPPHQMLYPRLSAGSLEARGQKLEARSVLLYLISFIGSIDP